MIAWLSCWFVVLAFSSGTADELSFAEPTVQVGKVYTGVPLSHRFAFQNTSAQALRITDVHTHCGCSIPRLALRVYEPGAKGFLDLEVLTLTQPAGPHNFSAHIEYQIGDVRKETEVNLQANLISELLIEPAKLVVPADHVERHPFTLTEARALPVQIIEARTSVPYVGVRLADPRRSENGRWARTLRLTAQPELSAGKHEGLIDLYTTDSRYEHLQVPFVLTKQSADLVSFSPREVDISAPAGKSLPTRVIVLRSQSPKEVQIGSITADHPAVAARWASNADGVIAIRVQVDASRLTGATLDSTLHIELRQPTRQTLNVPIHCKISD
jgi:hypothetical protein